MNARKRQRKHQSRSMQQPSDTSACTRVVPGPHGGATPTSVNDVYSKPLAEAFIAAVPPWTTWASYIAGVMGNALPSEGMENNAAKQSGLMTDPFRCSDGLQVHSPGNAPDRTQQRAPTTVSINASAYACGPTCRRAGVTALRLPLGHSDNSSD